MAGTGKSIIACIIAKNFHNQKIFGASFFFSQNIGDLGNIIKLISTLARQLASVSPLFKDYIYNTVTRNPNIILQGLQNQ